MLIIGLFLFLGLLFIILLYARSKNIAAPQISMSPDNSDGRLDYNDKYIIPQPPLVDSPLQVKIAWVLNCDLTLGMSLGGIIEVSTYITPDLLKDVDKRIRILAYRYEELHSLGGGQEGMYEYGKKLIFFSSGDKKLKDYILYLWGFFCRSYDFVFKDADFRNWINTSDFPANPTSAQLRLVLLILTGAHEQK